MERSSGVVMHITSLDGPLGIGSLGQPARDFVSFLRRGGQAYWQMLPLHPTGYGDSPYQCFSSFAGNPRLIDPDLLVRWQFVDEAQVQSCKPPRKAGGVDFEAVDAALEPLLRLAYSRQRTSWLREGQAFCRENREWLDDYSLFAALKEHFGGTAWQQWPGDIRNREKPALARYRDLLAKEVDFHRFVQYVFFRQLDGLKEEARARGIRLIGDLPIYAAEDSSDVWSHPELFALNEALQADEVAGVPPDYFTEQGQLWGNPLYDWPRHQATSYSWWKSRLAFQHRYFDCIRLDHFRGFWDYWSVPAGSADARPGRWRRGPGMDFVTSLRAAFPHLPIIAEDLGMLTPGAEAFIRQSGYPGMQVLQFSFHSARSWRRAPHNYPVDSICYTGTHDNTTLADWIREAPAAQRRAAVAYLGLNEEEGYVRGLIRGALASPSRLVMIPLQDWLGLGAEGRMNTPGTVGDNWKWRLEEGRLTDKLAKEMAGVSRRYGRELKRRRRT